MRVGYSIMREIKRKKFLPENGHYGLKVVEYERMIKLLEKEGYLERVLRVGDKLSLRPARLTKKGEQFLEEHKNLEESYPEDRNKIINWIQIDRITYSNGAEREE